MADLTAKQIQRYLALRWFDWRTKIIIPNAASVVRWESDLLILHESGWIEEIEIKISKADFRRDFTTKADKHIELPRGVPRRVWVGNEHVADWSEITPHLIRRFTFAMPLALAEAVESEVPAYCGLIGIGGTAQPGGVIVIRKAPQLRGARKATDDERFRLARLGYLRYWEMVAAQK